MDNTQARGCVSTTANQTAVYMVQKKQVRRYTDRYLEVGQSLKGCRDLKRTRKASVLMKLQNLFACDR